MSRRIRTHLRSNLVGYVALFVALSGTAYAAGKLSKNSVGTKQLRNGAVTQDKINPSAQAALKGQTGDPGPPGLSGYEVVSAQVGPDMTQDKATTATCPVGKIAISGGVDQNSPGDAAHIAFDRRSIPSTNVWAGGAHDPNAGDSWSLFVYAYCANVAP